MCLHISTKIQNLNRPTPYLNAHTFIYIYSINLFHYYLEYRVLVCKSCQYAIRPNHLVAHLRSDQHKLSQQQSEEIANQYKDYDLADPSMEIIAPQITTTPINYLAIYRDMYMRRENHGVILEKLVGSNKSLAACHATSITPPTHTLHQKKFSVRVESD